MLLYRLRTSTPKTELQKAIWYEGVAGIMKGVKGKENKSGNSIPPFRSERDAIQ